MIRLRLTTEYTYNILSILELNRTQTKGKMHRKCCVSFVFHIGVVWIDGRRQTSGGMHEVFMIMSKCIGSQEFG